MTIQGKQVVTNIHEKLFVLLQFRQLGAVMQGPQHKLYLKKNKF